MFLATALSCIIIDKGSSERPATATCTSCDAGEQASKQASKQASPLQANRTKRTSQADELSSKGVREARTLVRPQEGLSLAALRMHMLLHLPFTNAYLHLYYANRSLTRSTSLKLPSWVSGAYTVLLPAIPPSPSPRTDPGADGGGGGGVIHSSNSGSIFLLPAPMLSAPALLPALVSPKTAAKSSSPATAAAAAARAGAEELLITADARRRTVAAVLATAVVDVVVDVRRTRCFTRGTASGCLSARACSRGSVRKAATPAPEA